MCVNQRDDDEKGQQVSFMAQIYENADCVLVWLGEGSSETRAGIKHLKELAGSAWKYGIPDENPIAAADQLFSRNLKSRKTGIVLALQRLPLDGASLKFFFSQAWFHRLWVVQEYILGKRCLIYNKVKTYRRSIWIKQ